MTGRDLFDYYQTNEMLFSMHHWNPEYTDSLIPFEKDLYLKLLLSRIKRIQQAEESSNKL